MNFNDRAIERNRFNLDANDLRLLQSLEQAVEDTFLAPAIHSSVDRVPIAETLGKAPPLAALFSYVQDGVQHIKVSETNVAALLG